MLDTETKRRIDTARDILVGKLPDPKSQVEQITIALIYKFMDDMDAESEELGGHRKFFAGEFSRYGWSRLMRSGLGGHETLNLYAEAIMKMPENPGIPSLFRDIFKNAFLPYRDPETLRAFLKVIDGFTYDHSERLGDAFEYLLSVLGSQGDAGQFRTPRHIIDFIVEIIDPKKDEVVLDPACGTAGFLISSYKHILKANTDKKGNSTLSPDDKDLLARSFKGYDISPDMVRLSLVNMYLHGFTDPHIFEYDTLTSEDRWNEYADVIMANPPFMSPKGGIKPHRRFSIQAKRSEVLFVDYIAEHLNPNGRAGIIVPEGIIFQSQTAYKDLRKMLLNNFLVAVISLPAGVFNPYSGVKTSILILDKSIARQSNTIAFFKIENDGFGLGAQRRAVAGEQLTQAQQELTEYLQFLRSHQTTDGLHFSLGQIVLKEKIAANGDYNLSAERYREGNQRSSHYPHVELGDICNLYQPKTITQEELVENGPFFVFGANGIIGRFNKYNHEESEVLVTCRGATCGTINKSTPKSWVTGNAMVVKPKDQRLSKNFLYYLLKTLDLRSTISGSAQPQITRQGLSPFQIPLPPIEIQKEIVAEIEGYQKVIDGARAVLDNYQPHIPIDPEWPMVFLGDKRLFRVESGGTPNSNVIEYWNGGIPWATLVDLSSTDFISEITTTQRTISDQGLQASSAKMIPLNSIIVSTRATIGRIAINRVPISTNQGFKNIVIEDEMKVVPEYVALALTKLVPTMDAWATGGTFKEISKSKFCELQIPLPPLDVQKKIVEEIKSEQALVAANRELITRFEKKTQTTLARIWGKKETATMEV